MGRTDERAKCPVIRRSRLRAVRAAVQCSGLFKNPKDGESRRNMAKEGI